ncbi:60S ribosomal protein L3 [Pyronema domesticum]|uniref:Large ribosomal subunit protein mL44 n=1 Tax=Pyronema omphalodes (strain CBS 100304) TaxID=1076935 RepID=U4L8V1_PYROM|nr:60S ribosomal protein L3 [Pyronema domesticum]CCX09788.1 Similar to 54S ribosomal protein L3, mitochondrial; acc. no. O43042 [Pyronema omphalodes CBS 100304]
MKTLRLASAVRGFSRRNTRFNSTIAVTSEPLAPTILSTIPPSRNPAASAKLPALHARLALHPSYPIQTLARALVDPTADKDARFTNQNLSTLGNTLTGYYASEFLLVTYPRLPTDVLYAAVGAFVGNKALAALGREWGIETAFSPAADVDAGLLQYKHLKPGMDPKLANRVGAATQEHAMAEAVRAIIAGVHVHEGQKAAKQFIRQHILSRKLEVEKMFDFSQPTRELSRLCAREGFEAPVARMHAETGRRSHHPVFVVGVYSGKKLMGEGHGGSLDEARIRAAVNALKGWYLYSPLEKELPSSAGKKGFKAQFIDVGEVIV